MKEIIIWLYEFVFAYNFEVFGFCVIARSIFMTLGETTQFYGWPKNKDQPLLTWLWFRKKKNRNWWHWMKTGRSIFLILTWIPGVVFGIKMGMSMDFHYSFGLLLKVAAMGTFLYVLFDAYLHDFLLGIGREEKKKRLEVEK